MRSSTFTYAGLGRMLGLASGLGLTAITLVGCPSGTDGSDVPPPTPCSASVLGDKTKPIQLELRALKADGTDVALADGDNLAILEPPQGGRVSFIGVRATNLDGCGLQLTGALRDLGSQQVRVDGRTVNLQPEPDGWGTTSRGMTIPDFTMSAAVGDYANVPVCPNQWAGVDVFDNTFEVEVDLTDRSGRIATKTIKVTPRCAEPGASGAGCRCICKHGYVLGEACPAGAEP